MSRQSGNSDHEEQIMQAALRWHAATAGDDCDWDAFTTWLEQDPAHQEAYDAVAQLDDRISRHRAALQQSASRNALPARGRRGVFAAAAGVVLLGIGLALGWRDLPFLTAESMSYEASAAPRPVVLNDKTQVILMPHSRLSVGGRHQERLELTGGAYFDVPHDPDRTLTIRVGDYVVRDIGTRFELFGSARLLKLAVAEGSVAVELPGQPGAVPPVVAGQRVLIAGTPPVAEYASIDADRVGSWRAGQLEFQDEPLEFVAGQVGMHANVTVTVGESLADRRFSGVLVVGDGSQIVARLAEIMDLVVQPMGNAVHLSARDAPR